MTTDYLGLAAEIARRAKAKGADQCDCFIETGRELSVRVRSGEIEAIERAHFRGLGIRFFSDRRLGFGFTTDFSARSLDDLLEQCRAFALAATADPDSGMPEPVAIPRVDLEIGDPSIDERPLSAKTGFALACEASAFACDKRIRHAYATTYEEQLGRVIIARPESEPLFYDATSFEVFCAPVAEEGGQKRMGVWVSGARFFSDLEPAETIGQIAAQRALALLGARPVKTRKASVIFDSLTGSELVAEIFSALDGERVQRGMSFLKDRLGSKVASEAASFVDDGRMPRKMGSRPFDAEGIPTRRVVAVDRGLLKSYFHDWRSARKVGASPSGNARRGFASVPQVGENNFYLIPGTAGRDDLISGIDSGLLVTRLLGFGVNLTTGDYSRGAEGLWIEKGRIDRPVDGVTIAGNLSDMLAGLDEAASDLRFFGRFGSPTFVVREMTIAGE